MFKFIDITPENIAVLEQRFLRVEQAGTADEPRDTIEVTRKFKRARPVAIYKDSNLIAFLVYEALNPEKDNFLIWDFVVHQKFQGQGYGYAVMRQLIDNLTDFYQARRVELAIVPDNKPARELYFKLGFRENGKINSDGELEMDMVI